MLHPDAASGAREIFVTRKGFCPAGNAVAFQVRGELRLDQNQECDDKESVICNLQNRLLLLNALLLSRAAGGF